MTDATEAIGMGTAAASKRRTRKVLKNIPGFAYVLLIFIMIGAFVPNMREILFTVFGSYSLTWVEVIYLIATFTAMGELLRVSKPGIDNTVEALVMLGIGIVFLLLFVFGAMGVPLLGMFSTTEFLMLVLISGFQIGMAFLINARTLKRTFDTSAAHNDSDV
jgi:hypothetical protein